MRGKRSVLRRVIVSASTTALIMWLLLYSPTPYVVYEPGIAIPVDAMIAAQDADSPGEGEFLLTAVKLIEPNLWHVIGAAVDSDRDVFLKRDVFKGATKRQYVERLTKVMQGSQNDAVEAAYRYIGLSFKTKTQAIVIADVLSIAGRAASPFKAGDRLLGLKDDRRFEDVDDMLQTIGQLEAGGSIVFKVEREGEVKEVTIALPNRRLHDGLTTEELATTLGITGFTELRALVPDDEGKQIVIAAGEIGGPSAGLVFALQAIDMLTEGDLTNGASIAATGAIDASGNVSAIGGVKQKVVSTSAQGAELFLVPKRNEKEAKAKAKQLKTTMAIIGVDTLQEAIDAIDAWSAR